MTRAGRLTLALAVASFGVLPLASSVLAAPAPAALAMPSSAPASPQERLEQLDQLHADLELAKLRAAIAKANAEARDAAAGPAPGAGGAPPLPGLGPGSPFLNLAQLAPPGSQPGKGKTKSKPNIAEALVFTLVEAWGSGAERQAIIHSDAGDRLVRVGDPIPPGVVTGISGGAVTYRDAHGQTHSID